MHYCAPACRVRRLVRIYPKRLWCAEDWSVQQGASSLQSTVTQTHTGDLLTKEQQMQCGFISHNHFRV